MKTDLDNIVPRLVADPRFRWFRHLLLQFVLLSISINVFWDIPDTLVLTKDRFLSWVFFYLILNVIVYVNIFFLTPRLLMKNRLFIYLVFVLVLIIACMLTIAVLEFLFMGTATDTVPMETSIVAGIFNMISSIISIGLLVMGTLVIILFKSWITNSIRVGELESETLQAELALLKNQISPHFLFNMLNNSYLLIEKRKPEATEVLERLEDLLRYQIYEGVADQVELDREVGFLIDFLELEKVRRDNFEFTIRCDGNLQNIMIPSMLFIPFVENAAKHNNDSENGSYIELIFAVVNRVLHFSCVNSKPPIPAASNEIGGIGLKNICRRLELLFPERHTLQITDEENTYTIKLTIEI